MKIREKKSGGTKNTRNSRSQCLVTLGRDKTQRNPSLNFKGISFVISNIVASNSVTPNSVSPNSVTPNIVTTKYRCTKYCDEIKIFGVSK